MWFVSKYSICLNKIFKTTIGNIDPEESKWLIASSPSKFVRTILENLIATEPGGFP